MDRNIHNNLLISITSIFFMIGMMGTRPLVPLLSSELGADTLQIGIIVALFVFLPFLAAVKLGKTIDRIGCKLPILISSFVGNIAIIIPFFYTGLLGIYLSQLFGGITQTLFIIAAQRFAGRAEDQLTRDKNVMIFSIGMAIGSFIGPLFGGYLADWHGYAKAFGILALVGMLSMLSSSLLKEQKETTNKIKKVDRPSKGNNVFYLFKTSNIRRAFLISSLVLLGKDIYIAYFPLLANDFGLSNKSIGFIVAINAAAGILIRWIMPLLIKQFGRNRVITGSILGSGIFFIILPFFKGEISLALWSFLLGMGLGLGQPLSVAITIDALPKNRVGEGLGLRLTVNRFTQLLAPVVFGMVAKFFSMSVIFWGVGVLIIIGSTKIRIQEQANFSTSSNMRSNKLI